MATTMYRASRDGLARVVVQNALVDVVHLLTPHQGKRVVRIVPRVGRSTSYHETLEEARATLVASAERSADLQTAALDRAIARLEWARTCDVVNK